MKVTVKYDEDVPDPAVIALVDAFCEWLDEQGLKIEAKDPCCDTRSYAELAADFVADS